MPDILTITLNPTVDISTTVPGVAAGLKLRCAFPTVDPGGGGINVSRAIRHLGGTSIAFVAFSGATGQRLAKMLADEGITTTAFAGPGETRQSFAVTDTTSGQQYRFVMPGPEWPQQTVTAVLPAIQIAAPKAGIVIASGSQPPGVPPGFLANLVNELQQNPGTVIVDTSGPSLRYLVEAPVGVNVLRMDAAEAEDLAGHALPSRAETAAFADRLVRSGVANLVLVARGADGTTLVTKDEKLHCARAVEKVVSAVGAGDSFVGGFALALARGAANTEALRHATAAASAAVLTEATQLCTREDAERLLPGCELTTL